MAQPVFDEHPLEQYLRESGEARENMPGGSTELSLELNQHEYDDEPDNDNMQPSVLEQALLVLSSTYNAYFGRNTDSPFAERFKYDVISSSLLSTSLPLPHPASTRQTRSRSLAVPGDLLDRSSSSSHISEVHDATNPPRSFHLESHHPYWVLSLAISFAILLFSTRYYFWGILVITGAASFAWFSVNDTVLSPPDTTQTSLHTLHELIQASDLWDSAVQSALASIEKDEMAASSPFSFSSSGSQSPSSSLRVALNTSLHATQKHCDNVRHLLMALTAPTELVQLAEMYAPPSPSPFMPASPSTTVSGLHGLRPMTLPTSPTSSRYSAESPNAKRAAKRTTWNGFNPSTNGGFLLQKRREKRRSDLSALFRPQSSTSTTQSLPVTPAAPQTPPLQEVLEETEPASSSGLMTPEDDEESTFGNAALALRRKYRSGGLDTLGLLSPPLPTSPAARSLRSSQSNNSLNSGSRFTTLQTPHHDRDRDREHPIGVYTLKNALSRALASKRYACSHLLALRFHDEEYDEAYWEDVSSVMGLLTTTFRDTSSSLVEAADDLHHSNKKYERASPESVKNHERVSADLMLDDDEEDEPPKMARARTVEEIVSFAPIPTHLSRFAVHVDAISAALNDARENLEECVAEVRKHRPEQSPPRRPTHTRGQSSTSQPGGVEEHPALKAYERLRRELGLALRECERGRERLLDSIAPPRPSAYFEEEEEDEDVPALAHDVAGSSESDRPEPPEDDSLSPLDQAYIVSPDDSDVMQPYTSPFHNVPEQIPPPGIEQVFEAESGNDTTFARERSKLTREERIALVKKLRESGSNHVQILAAQSSTLQTLPTREKTGPGIEVVQELKDVIWKVGERRRKLAEAEEGDSS